MIDGGEIFTILLIILLLSNMADAEGDGDGIERINTVIIILLLFAFFNNNNNDGFNGDRNFCCDR